MALYLDVEATYQGKLTVIGLHHDVLGTVQLVGDQITRANLEAALPMAICVYTYDGDRYDLALIKDQVGVDLRNRYRSVDLKVHCQAARLHGGLKSIEQRLGITRKHAGMSGKDAVALWYTYQTTGCQESLEKLLAYNREDVENLKVLREVLDRRFARC
jgi:uncharacterized protein YprB with RNaseH-like and TPR domain